MEEATAQATQEKTLGEKRVRTSFNVAEGETRSSIDELKTKAAEFIDLINEIPAADGEAGRLKALAMTATEEAAMWAVKAATA